MDAHYALYMWISLYVFLVCIHNLTGKILLRIFLPYVYKINIQLEIYVPLRELGTKTCVRIIPLSLPQVNNGQFLFSWDERKGKKICYTQKERKKERKKEPEDRE